MPFRHKIDKKLDLVVLKVTGKVSVSDIINEIKTALTTKRGMGISRRLIDMREQAISFDLATAKKLLTALQIQAKTLHSKKIALLFTHIPDNLELDQLDVLLNSPAVEIGVFTDKTKSIEFLNKVPEKKSEKTTQPPKVIWTLKPQP